ncbi:MAG: hypothetical protein U0175_00535 [Caldilineaceae bacterium]
MYGLTLEEISVLCEMHELEAGIDLYRHLPIELHQRFRAEVRRFGSCAVLMTHGLNLLPLNRVVGLGIGAPATEALLDNTIACFAAAGLTDFSAQISPSAEPVQLRSWLLARGFEQGLGTPKFVRGNEAVADLSAGIRVEQIGAECVLQFAEIFGTAFGLSPNIWPLFTGAIGKPGWYHYLGFDGAQPIATGAMYLKNDIAWLGVGSTHKDYRNRGGQSAMITRRLTDGLALGCKWFITETGKDTSEQPNPSYRNMIRAGFKVAYIRDNYLHQTLEHE